MTLLVSEPLRGSLSAPTAAMAGRQGTFSLWEPLSPALCLKTAQGRRVSMEAPAQPGLLAAVPTLA